MHRPSPPRRPSSSAIPPLRCVVALLLALASCRGEPRPAAAPRPALEPLLNPDLGTLDPGARTQITEARQALDQLLAQSDASDEELGAAFGRLGWLYHAYEMRGPAAPCYRNAAALLPGAFAWPYCLGCLHAGQGEHDLATAAHERALALNPAYLPAILALGRLALDANDLDRAESCYRRARHVDPACAPAFFGLGMVASARQDHAAAAQQFERALALQPHASAIHYPLAQAYRALGDAERARQHLALRGNDPPTTPDPVLAQMAALPAGSSHLEKRGVESGKEGQLASALRDLEQAAAAQPERGSVRINLGTALALSGSEDRAIDEYREAIRLDPEAPQAHFNLATLLARKGQQQEAREHFRQAVTIDPDYTDAHLGLGDLAASQGDHAAAAAHYARVIALDPRHRAARLNHALALAGDGRYAGAKAALQEARAVLPDSMLIAHALARLLAAAPDTELRDGPLALELALTAYQVRQSPDHAETVAMAYAELGNFDEAIRWQAQAIALLDPARRAPAEARLARYREGQPCRDPWPAPRP